MAIEKAVPLEDTLMFLVAGGAKEVEILNDVSIVPKGEIGVTVEFKKGERITVLSKGDRLSGTDCVSVRKDGVTLPIDISIFDAATIRVKCLE